MYEKWSFKFFEFKFFWFSIKKLSINSLTLKWTVFEKECIKSIELLNNKSSVDILNMSPIFILSNSNLLSINCNDIFDKESCDKEFDWKLSIKWVDACCVIKFSDIFDELL